MNAKFLKFKTGALLIRIAKALSSGGFALGVTAGSLMFLRRFEVIGLRPLFIWLIAAGAFLAVGGGVYILLRKSDKRLATDLDMRYGLEDRVHSMLEFKDREGAIYELQRRDAEHKLSQVSPSPAGLRFLWIYVSALLLSLAFLTVSLIVKPEEEPPDETPEVTTPFELSEMDALAMEDLINYVLASDMESPYRENLALILTELLDNARVTTTAERMKEHLADAIGRMLAETDASSFAVEIIDALWQSDSDAVGKLAKAINYYTWSAEGGWDSFEEGMRSFREQFIHSESLVQNPDVDKMVTETMQLLSGAGSSLAVSLRRSGADGNDALYNAIEIISAANPDADGGSIRGLLLLSATVETLGYTSTQNSLDELVTAVKIGLYDAIETNRTNTSVGEYAIQRVCQIFGYAIPKFERPDLYEKVEVNGGGGDDEGGGGTGGIGGEGAEFGSDDLVLDPDTDRYVEYGTILNKYQAIMSGKVSAGAYTEDEIAALRKYYDILWGGFEDENE